MDIIEQITDSADGIPFILYGEPRFGRTRWAGGIKPRIGEELVLEGNRFHELLEAYFAGRDIDSLTLQDEFDYAIAREIGFGEPSLQIPPVSYDPANNPIVFGGIKL